MSHIYVYNGKVDKTKTKLPLIWNNISNFNSLSEDKLLQFGWYKLIRITADTVPYDEVIIKWDYVLYDTYVEYKPITRKISETELEKKIQFELEKKWDTIRRKRNALLLESDWTQVTDSPLTDENKEQWRVYRQKLREITNVKSPEYVVYPTKPATIKRDTLVNNFYDMGSIDITGNTMVEYFTDETKSDSHYEYITSGSGDWYNYYMWKQIEIWEPSIPSLKLNIYDLHTKELLASENSNNPITSEWLVSIDGETWAPLDNTVNVIDSYLMVRSFAFDFDYDYKVFLTTVD